jgi:hypothetical protein
LFKIDGGVKRRVGVFEGETLTMMGKEESIECSINVGEHSGQEHLIKKRC